MQIINDKPVIKSQPINPQKAVKEYRVHLGILSPRPRPIPNLFSTLRCWYFYSALRLCLSEIGALGHRIRRVLEIREVELLRGKETVREWMAGCAVSGPYTPDYMRYMQRTMDDNPFLSIFDSLLLTQAWRAGSESSAPKDTLHGQESRHS